MALVSSSHADHRIYQPSFECDYPSPHQQSKSRSCLLVKIHNSYCKAMQRLNVRLTPTSAAYFLYGGCFCFGFLDPVSNIIVNTAIPYDLDKKARDATVVTQTELKDLERRSLDGLVTFLTRLFPYLADCEAVRYLLFADADVLVAAQIIALDRQMKNFGESPQALVMALKCAALAAGHPDPERLITAWKYLSQDLSSVLDKLSSVVRRRSSSHDCLLMSLFGGLFDIFPGPPEPLAKGIRELWYLVASRRPRRCNLPYQHTNGLKRVLLDAIHGFYLKALARLPISELQSRYHRSLLTAGYCYGPLDPVSNIILNTIWYDAMFPPTHRLKMDVVSTMSLHRIGSRSLYGMISFLCTRYHHLDFHQAACHLLQADASLVGADAYFGSGASTSVTARFPTLGKVGPDTTIDEAFKATALAARHPKPDDQVNLFASCERKLSSIMWLLQSGRQLSSNDVQQISRLMCPESPCSEQSLPLFPLKAPLHEHMRVSKKVNAVLDTYNHHSKTVYQVHIICGVNTQVSGPVYCPGGSTFAPHKCLRTHVNFTVTQSDTPLEVGEACGLFFAELSNADDEESGAHSFCCPVSVPPPRSERVRCLFCDFVGTRIVHPIDQIFHGREKEFERMVCGQDPCEEEPTMMKPYFTNMSIISQSDFIADELGSLEEDCLYADSFDEPKSDMDMEFIMDDYTISDDSISDDSMSPL